MYFDDIQSLHAILYKLLGIWNTILRIKLNKIMVGGHYEKEAEYNRFWKECKDPYILICQWSSYLVIFL